MYKKKILWISLLLLCVLASVLYFTRDEPIDFSVQVKPIINKNCITCHGGVKAKAGFSLLFREDALAKTESGKPAIIPGNPGASEMIRRINLTDPEERMPYKHPALTKEEINILTRWVKEGAKWGEHWAYVPLKPIETPDITDSWAKNDIDKFILDKLDHEKLKPSAEADKATLLRRVSLDLTGMLPTQTEADKYLHSNNANAYETLVDSLLASPHFGERWASLWLDLARYADTKGYESDPDRRIWRYRDWVINAFNQDKPYDQFLVEQIAGDLLPHPTDAQYIATAFQRNTMTNDEGGTDNEEFRTAAVMDRTSTTWTALMGTTFNCVQCHSHPYDPFRHEDYFKFMAYFNDARDEDTNEDFPLLREYKTPDSIKLVKMQQWLTANASPQQADDIYRFTKTWQPAINSNRCDSFINGSMEGSFWAALRKNGQCRLKNVDLTNKTELLFRYRSRYPGGSWKITLDKPDGQELKTVPLKNTNDGETFANFSFAPVSGVHNLYFHYINPSFKDTTQTAVVFIIFHFSAPFPGVGKPGYDSAYKYYNDLLNLNSNDVRMTPIMMDNPPDMHREQHVFERGNWLVKGALVTPGVPQSLAYAMPKNAPANRLGLAMWLTNKQNPLVARTMTNRLWEQLFGAGLAETLEDMGTQGIPPTHRELLDYLSYQFMNKYKWSIKTMLKEMVMSATYRQDSKETEELKQKDPYNKLYARGARIRLSAEQVRDQALCVSGALNDAMFGKSVFPYQPGGVWHSPYNGDSWNMSTDGNQYRRAVYTYIKRTAGYPSMITYDGASREVCTPRRIRTNTPLQALVSLNDSVFVDLARQFAYRMQQTTGSTAQQQIATGYNMMLYKTIAQPKLQALLKLYNEALIAYKDNTAEICALNGGMNAHATPETAALIVVANAMLNLDEVVTKN